MSLAPWSGFPQKDNVVGEDRIAIRDFEDADPTTTNKEITVNDFLNTPNILTVRKTEDLPDRLPAAFTSVADNTSGDARFIFTVAHGYLDGQRIKISSVLPVEQVAYEGVHTIKVITAFQFDVIGLSFGANATGNCIRLIPKNTGYRLVASIITAFGYELEDESNLTIFSPNTSNTITVAGFGQTFLTGRLVKVINLRNLVVNGVPPPPPVIPGQFTQILFNLEGVYGPNTSALVCRHTTFPAFASLGSVDGLTIAWADSAFIAYGIGMQVTNCLTNIANCAMLPFSASNTPWLSFNNIQKGLFDPIANTEIPFAVTMTNLTVFNSVNAPVLFINPANNEKNEIAITGSTKSLGGNFFKLSRVSQTGTITAFSDSTARPGTHTKVTAVNTFGSSTDVQKARITNTINYNRDFLVSAPTSTTFDIDIVFLPSPAPVETSGNFDQLLFISQTFEEVDVVVNFDSIASNGRGGVTITDADDLPSSFIDGRRITISGTTNFNGEFKILNVKTKSFDILKPAFPTESGAATMQLTELFVQKHGLATNTIFPAFIDESLRHDGGGIAKVLNVFDIQIDVPFTVGPTDTGLLFDGSLTGKSPNVLVDNVSGVSNSKAKGSFFMSGNSQITEITANIFTDLNLNSLAKETKDTVLFKLIDPNTGELEFRGLEPFSGQLAAVIFVTKDGGGQPIDYILRAVKNDGRMVDDIVTPFSAGGDTISASFFIPITADKKGDRFKLQVTQSGGNDVVIESVTVVIQ